MDSEVVMRKSLTLLLVTLLGSLAATAQSGNRNLQSDLEALHAKWLKAYDSGDVATHESNGIRQSGAGHAQWPDLG